MLSGIIGNFHELFLPDEAALTLRELVKGVARSGMLVADVGTAAGYSSLVMLPTVADYHGRVHGVDWYRGSPTATGPAGEDGYGCGTILGAAFNNVRDNGYLDSWRLYVGLSEEYAQHFEDNSFDLVYIAADHRFCPLMRDIDDWQPKLRSGGIICGHQFEEEIRSGHFLYDKMVENLDQDYVDLHHFGVIYAVQECFSNFKHQSGIWWATKECYKYGE